MVRIPSALIPPRAGASRRILRGIRSIPRVRLRPEHSRRRSPVSRRNRASRPCRKNIRCCASNRRNRLLCLRQHRRPRSRHQVRSLPHRRVHKPPRRLRHPLLRHLRARPCQSRSRRPHRSNRAIRRHIRLRPRLKILQLLRSVCRFRRKLPRDGTRDRV
jgi:hypothetical protein